ncbi:MAG: type II secretion system GspH family protein [Phycisphaerales bacterium]|nr:type II secretion system GspH family protein [Phycisphaerales bacterium]
MKRARRHRVRPRGFTLVELLCCCVLVGLMIGLLLPALGAAREAGRGAGCASNLRQLQLSLDAYANDNRSRYAPAAPDALANRTRWFGSRASTSLSFDPQGGPLSDYLDGSAGEGVRKCGSFNPAGGPNAFERACGGYGYNRFFVGAQMRRSEAAWLVENDRTGAATAGFSDPASVVSFADCALFAGGGGVIEYSFAEPRWWPSNPSSRPDPSIHFRHGNGRARRSPGEARLAWLDGHISGAARGFTWSSGVYGTPVSDPLLGWPSGPDDNTLFGSR